MAEGAAGFSQMNYHAERLSTTDASVNMDVTKGQKQNASSNTISTSTKAKLRKAILNRETNKAPSSAGGPSDNGLDAGHPPGNQQVHGGQQMIVGEVGNAVPAMQIAQGGMEVQNPQQQTLWITHSQQGTHYINAPPGAIRPVHTVQGPPIAYYPQSQGYVLQPIPLQTQPQPPPPQQQQQHQQPQHSQHQSQPQPQQQQPQQQPSQQMHQHQHAQAQNPHQPLMAEGSMGRTQDLKQSGGHTALRRISSEPIMPGRARSKRPMRPDKSSPHARHRETRKKVSLPDHARSQKRARSHEELSGSEEEFYDDDPGDSDSVTTAHSSTSQLAQQFARMQPQAQPQQLQPQHQALGRQTSLPPVILGAGTGAVPQPIVVGQPHANVVFVQQPHMPLQATYSAPPGTHPIAGPSTAVVIPSSQAAAIVHHSQQPGPHSHPQAPQHTHRHAHPVLGQRLSSDSQMSHHRKLEASSSCPSTASPYSPQGHARPSSPRQAAQHPLASMSSSSSSATAASGTSTRAAGSHPQLRRTSHRTLTRVSDSVIHRDLENQAIVAGQRHVTKHRPLGNSSSADAQLVGDASSQPARRPSPPQRNSPLPSLQEHAMDVGDDEQHAAEAGSVVSAGSHPASRHSSVGQQLLSPHEPVHRAYSAPNAHQIPVEATPYTPQRYPQSILEGVHQVDQNFVHETKLLDEMTRQLEQQHLSEIEVLKKAYAHSTWKRNEYKNQLMAHAQRSPGASAQPSGMPAQLPPGAAQPGVATAAAPNPDGRHPMLKQVPASAVGAPGAQGVTMAQSDGAGRPGLHAVVTQRSSLSSSISQGPASPGSATTSPPLTGGTVDHQPMATVLAYDTAMLRHTCPCSTTNHIEHPGRLQSIKARLCQVGLEDKCIKTKGRKATHQELTSVHSENHTNLYFGNGKKKVHGDSSKYFVKMRCDQWGVDADTVWNESHTGTAARIAAGTVIELATHVATGNYKNGYAIVRPPGHHAEQKRAMAFCYFNNVAVAATQLLLHAHAQKILIFDWSIHHGNGTHDIFYDSDSVLYISIHRFDHGKFFPGTGAAEQVGDGVGKGHTVNIPFSFDTDTPLAKRPTIGDAEYLAAFRNIVYPIAREFSPDIVLVSAGFDAMANHSPQIGGYSVSAQCYGYMTQELMKVTNIPGKVVLALEGGYSLPDICDASEACTRALLDLPMPPLAADVESTQPDPACMRAINKTAQTMSPYWACMRNEARGVDQMSETVAAAKALQELSKPNAGDRMEHAESMDMDQEQPGESSV